MRQGGKRWARKADSDKEGKNEIDRIHLNKKSLLYGGEKN